MANYETYYREYFKKRYAQRKAWAIELLGGVCITCGSPNDLEIDHVDPTLKSFNISQGWGKSLIVLEAELKKCQLLCKKHHLGKTSLENSIKMKNNKIQKPAAHGGFRRRYIYKCHCELCEVFHKARMAQRRLTKDW